MHLSSKKTGENMKCITIFILAILFSCKIYAYSNEEIKFIPCKNVYVDPNQIYMGVEGLFVNVHDTWIQTEGIHNDAQGYYFNSARADEWSLKWTCPYCKTENGILNSYCKNVDCPTRKKNSGF